MSCGVTVAHRILVPLVWVRILAGQQKIENKRLITNKIIQSFFFLLTKFIDLI